jgi:predicted nucleic acid-binding protein
MARGILDTSTLILLGRISETDSLPAEPVITAITLAELSVGPLVASISTDLPLHTCNPRDFTGIDELTMVPVPHPDH